EVRSGRALDAIGAVREVNGVQVRREDAVLVPVLLELPGERRLLQLARDRAVVAGQLVLHELLRDRRAALNRRLVLDVGEQSAAHPADVDPAMLVEAPVLRRDDRLLDPRVDRSALYKHAALA